MTLFFLLLGLVLLVVGGELLVRGAVQLAQKFRISPLLIGLTLVGFGTSTPELVTSLQAAFADSPGIAVGNVVGSNVANILLILGVTALIFPVVVAKETFKRDGIVLALGTVMCLGAVLYGQLTPLLGAVFVASLAGYIYFAFRQERQSNAAADAAAGMTQSDFPAPSLPLIALDLLFVVGGLVLTIFGARFLVTSAIEIATAFNVSETVIGLTIVAVGTSLPELVTSVMAALRKHSDIAFGNIVGSNIYNIFGILGVTAIIKPIDVPSKIASLDIWVMIAATVLLFITATSRWRIGRVEGGIMLAAYVGYCVWLGMNSAA